MRRVNVKGWEARGSDSNGRATKIIGIFKTEVAAKKAA